jgi:hypothetical protein
MPRGKKTTRDVAMLQLFILSSLSRAKNGSLESCSGRAFAMFTPRMKSLQNTADAAGGAFGFDEADFEPRYVSRARPGRVAMLVLAIGGGTAALAHQTGFASFLAAISGWRAAA